MYSHFLPSIKGYNNRLTVYVYTIAKIMFNSLALLENHSQACLNPQALVLFLNGPNLPGQTDSCTKLAGETGHRCSYMYIL